MSRKLDGPAGMIGGAHLPSAALLHEAKLGKVFTFLKVFTVFSHQTKIIKPTSGVIL